MGKLKTLKELKCFVLSILIVLVVLVISYYIDDNEEKEVEETNQTEPLTEMIDKLLENRTGNVLVANPKILEESQNKITLYSSIHGEDYTLKQITCNCAPECLAYCFECEEDLK